MKTRCYARKPEQDVSGISAAKLLQTRPFQADNTHSRQRLQTQADLETISKGFDLTQGQSFLITDEPRSALGQPLQARLMIGAANDKYEREADQVATQVVEQIHSVGIGQPLVQGAKRIRDECEIQRLPLVQQGLASGGEASEDLESAISRAKGSGQPLDVGLQQSMGQAMGADFSGVQVHTGAQADALNQSIQARAFTTGQDMFFRQGEYQPRSQKGQELIAHELTHVVQQGGQGGEQIGRSLILQRNVGYEFEDKTTKVINVSQIEYRGKEKLEGYNFMLSSLKANRLNSKIFSNKLDDFEAIPDRKTPVIKGTGWTLETDDTMGDANIEFVIHGPRKIKDGYKFSEKNELSTALDEITLIAQGILKKKPEAFLASEVASSGKAVNDMVIDCRGSGEGAYITQATAGIRLDQLANVMTASGAKVDENEDNEFTTKAAYGRKQLSDNDKLLGKAPGAAKAAIEKSSLSEELKKSSELLGFVSLTRIYLHGAKFFEGGKTAYLKNLTPLMARTDFGKLYDLLPSEVKKYFEENKDEWITINMNAAGLDPKERENSFAPKVEEVEFTCAQWLAGMQNQEDLLAKLPDDYDDSMGALGQKVDSVESDTTNTLKAPIFEFRQAEATSSSTFKPWALDFFEYASEIDKGNSKALLEKKKHN